MKDHIIVAFDTQDKKQFDFLFNDLKNDIGHAKIGMEAFYTFGIDVIERFKKENIKVFLDLKLHDIPSTVEKASRTLSKLGVDILNVHAAGGVDMMKAAALGFKENQTNGKMIAVTQLTSTNQDIMNNELKIPGLVEQQVEHMATLTKSAGLDGIVSSAGEVKKVKARLGLDFICVTPGIRPKGSDQGDQKRIYTPMEAITSGADYLVIGRPITQAPSPKEAYLKILEDIKL